LTTTLHRRDTASEQKYRNK